MVPEGQHVACDKGSGQTCDKGSGQTCDKGSGQTCDKGSGQTCDKGSGQTSHVERFNNTLRQRLARFVRKTLSFSKSEVMHEDCLRLFLHHYNTRMAPGAALIQQHS